MPHVKGPNSLTPWGKDNLNFDLHVIWSCTLKPQYICEPVGVNQVFFSVLFLVRRCNKTLSDWPHSALICIPQPSALPWGTLTEHLGKPNSLFLLGPEPLCV